MKIFSSDLLVASPVISVKILAYNHEKYISECLDHVLSQKCNVPYEIIVSDDCSSDKTPEILLEYQRKYPEKFLILLQDKNQGILNNYADALSYCRGKYIASCAGDDYWCDDFKLQKQYDCLESRKGFGFVRTAGWRLIGKQLTPSKDGEYNDEGDVRELIKYGPSGLASSIFFERDLLQFIDLRQWNVLGFTLEDWPMQAIFAHHTKFAYIADRCIVYRATKNSISKNKSFEKRINFALGKVKVQRFLRDLYPEELSDVYPEIELKDREAYLNLTLSIYHLDYDKALAYKRQIKSKCYKSKYFVKYLRGKGSMYFCFLLLRIKNYLYKS